MRLWQQAYFCFALLQQSEPSLLPQRPPIVTTAAPHLHQYRGRLRTLAHYRPLPNQHWW